MKQSMCLDRVAVIKNEWQPQPLVRSSDGTAAPMGGGGVVQYESVLPGNVGRPVSHWLQQWSCRLFLHQLSSSVATAAPQSLSTTTSGREANRSGISFFSLPKNNNNNNGNCVEVRNKTTATNEEGQCVHAC